MRFVESEHLLACVHCGLCLASCPTYVALGTEADSPRGRIHLMRALEEGRRAPTPDAIAHLDACLGCRACETACPSGVPYGRLIEAARPWIETRRPRPVQLARRALAAALTSPLGTLPLRLARALPGLKPLARRLKLRPLAYAASLPRPRGRGRLPEVLEPDGPPRGTAVLLTGCVAGALFDDTNRATAALLRRAGVRVVVPRTQGCCGALGMHLGQGDSARAQAEATAAALDVAGADWVVANAAGCGAMLHDWAHLLPDDPHARAVAAKARDALELLAELGLPAPERGLARSVAVHDPCHLAHGQGVRTPVRALLASVPGVELRELTESDWCCGSAGTYNLTEPSMAAQLADRKLDRIAASGAEVVAAANPGCLLQIRAGALLRGLEVEVVHPIDLLAAAHGVAR